MEDHSEADRARGAAVLGVAALALAACGEAPEETTTAGSSSAASVDYKACMVSDAGGFDDKSFNQAGFEGLTQAETELGIEIAEVESAADTDYTPNIDQLVSQNCNLIIGVGFLLEDRDPDGRRGQPGHRLRAGRLLRSPNDDFSPVELENGKPLLFNTAAGRLPGRLPGGRHDARPAPSPPSAASRSRRSRSSWTASRTASPSTTRTSGTDVKLLGWDKATQTGVFTGDFDNQANGTNLAKHVHRPGRRHHPARRRSGRPGCGRGRQGGRQRQDHLGRLGRLRDHRVRRHHHHLGDEADRARPSSTPIKQAAEGELRRRRRTSARWRTRASASRRSTTSTSKVPAELKSKIDELKAADHLRRASSVESPELPVRRELEPASSTRQDDGPGEHSARAVVRPAPHGAAALGCRHRSPDDGVDGGGRDVKLELRGITKVFGSLVANDHIDLVVEPGEIHALLGENGAGKSTLMNVLYGLYDPDGGEILVDDKPVTFAGPGEAMAAGIGMVHQHFMLVPGVHRRRERRARARADAAPAGMHRPAAAPARRCSEISDRFGFHVDPDALVEDLPVGAQQRVEIIKALSREAEVLILDEPTAVLTPQETDELIAIMRQLKESGHLDRLHHPQAARGARRRRPDHRDPPRQGGGRGASRAPPRPSSPRSWSDARSTSASTRPPATPGETTFRVRGLTVSTPPASRHVDDVELRRRARRDPRDRRRAGQRPDRDHRGDPRA